MTKSDYRPNRDFILEACRGRHELHDEERLTRVFVAAFNHSYIVRRAVGRLFKIKCSDSCAFAERGESVSGTKGRRDIEIYSGNRPILIIENKIASYLTKGQLSKYKRSRQRTKVAALIRGLASKDRSIPKSFLVKRWSQLDDIIHIDKDVSSTSDRFVAQQLSALLKENRMDNRDLITRQELARCAKLIHQIRFSPNPSDNLGFNQFDVLSEWVNYLEDIVDSANESRHLVTRFGKKNRSSPILSNWYVDTGDEKKRPAWLGIWMPLKREYSGVKYLTFGLWVRFNKDWCIEISALDRGRSWAGNKFILKRKNSISKDQLRREVLKAWNRWVGLKPTKGLVG